MSEENLDVPDAVKEPKHISIGEIPSKPTPIEITHPEKVSIKYQGLTISLQDLLNQLNEANLLPESIESQE